jgi:hypothetical protein
MTGSSTPSPSGGEEENEIKLMTVVSRPPTAAREPVGNANVNINGIMKTFLCTGRYYTSPNRVRPPGAEIPKDIDLATSFSNSNTPCAADIEPASESSENDRNNDGAATGEPASIESNIPSGSRGSVCSRPGLENENKLHENFRPANFISRNDITESTFRKPVSLETSTCPSDVPTATVKPIMRRRASATKESVNTFLNRDSKNEFNQDPTGNTSTGSSSESDPISTWTALLTQSMSVLSVATIW